MQCDVIRLHVMPLSGIISQLPDLITFYRHYSSGPNPSPISSNLMFAVHQCINLVIEGSRGEKGNTHNVLNAVLQLNMNTKQHGGKCRNENPSLLKHLSS